MPECWTFSFCASKFYGAVVLISECMVLCSWWLWYADQSRLSCVLGQIVEIWWSWLTEENKMLRPACCHFHSFISPPNLTSPHCALCSVIQSGALYSCSHSHYCTICALCCVLVLHNTSAVHCGAVVQFVQMELNLWRSCQKRNWLALRKSKTALR